jgi:hypothetical protein
MDDVELGGASLESGNLRGGSRWARPLSFNE